MAKAHGRRVICLGKRGTVIHEGPEQSEVAFDDGHIQIVINQWMSDVPDDALTEKKTGTGK